MKTIKAKDFSKRSELEDKIRSLYGLTTEAKDCVIEGTREELARLSLCDTNVFWGISCKITDTPTQAKTQAEVSKPERGEIHKSGINLSK